jgi:hypothetical protein
MYDPACISPTAGNETFCIAGKKKALLSPTGLFKIFDMMLNSSFNSSYVDGAQTFWGLLNIKFNFLSIFQAFLEAKIFYIIPVNKDILATIFGLYKAKPFFSIEPFYFTVLHTITILLCTILYFSFIKEMQSPLS